ncbi:DUF4843 domain-containing protein [Flavobacterium hydrophilum]|uniref:DUF4843 domain-containing protein n=1 Tax=Flavobacterium hydrophilum TaxID=2211445 RepID=A0A2V4C3X4_9FLAO|nr:DUF4843 domain-containing protein [Flavobacterium hydrophilum]PXY45998.1 hypothetical protein DMB68_02085 [Flavobacterium hydrophilum]
MNKILILSILFLSLLGFTSCEKEEIATYEATDNIYFSNAMFAPNKISAPLIDSTGFSFGLDNPAITERIFKIPIRVQGKLSNVDRKVKLTIDPTSTAVAGTHFSIPDVFIHAGQEVDTIEVTVFRAPDMKNNSFTLVLNLEENEFFTTNMKSKVVNALTNKTMSFIRYKLSFDDKLTQPAGWYAPYLGVFTAKKFFLMCDLMQLNPAMFSQKLGAAGLTIPEVVYYQTFMKRYLADQKKSGNTIYEDDGTEMTIP